MDLWAGVAAIDHRAGIPEGPSSERSRAWDAGGVGFDEVELVGRVVIDCAAKKGQEDEEGCAGNEDEGDETEDGSCCAQIAESVCLWND